MLRRGHRCLQKADENPTLQPMGTPWRNPPCPEGVALGSQGHSPHGQGCRGPPHKLPQPSPGYGVLAAAPSPIAMPAPRGPSAPPGPAAPLSPAHFKRPHLSPSAAFEPGKFPAGTVGSPRPLTVIENLRLMGFPRLGAQRLINLPGSGMGGPGGPQHRTPRGSPATALSGAPQPRGPPAHGPRPAGSTFCSLIFKN